MNQIESSDRTITDGFQGSILSIKESIQNVIITMQNTTMHKSQHLHA